METAQDIVTLAAAAVAVALGLVKLWQIVAGALDRHIEDAVAERLDDEDDRV